MGLVREAGDAWLVLGECTPNADRHDPDDLARRIADFRAALGAARADTAAGRFLRLDSRDMAEQYGLDPGPGSASEAKPAGPPGSFEP